MVADDVDAKSEGVSSTSPKVVGVVGEAIAATEGAGRRWRGGKPVVTSRDAINVIGRRPSQVSSML
jgi:hypothetical protein